MEETMTAPAAPRHKAAEEEAMQQATMKTHRMLDCLPLMTDAQLTGLAADIKRNGLRQPITITEIDGEDVIVDAAVGCVHARLLAWSRASSD
jgi:hypothetical protein